MTSMKEQAVSKKGSTTRVFRFWNSQIQQIHKGGSAVLWYKVRLFFGVLLGAILSFPFVILLRLLKPIVHVRLGSIRSDRIGHMAPESELYLCRKDAGLDKNNTVDIFFHVGMDDSLRLKKRDFSSPICNQQLKKMWDRRLRVFQLACWPDWLNNIIPGGEDHVIPQIDNRDRDGLLEQFPVHITFNEKEEEKGRELLKEMGISQKDSFICFHSRDFSYLANQYSDFDWQYQSYRDSNIEHYLPAVKELSRRGHFALRMGTLVEKKFDIREDKVIDYATSDQHSDFMDIYLLSKCRFFLCSCAGISGVPMLFRRPIAFVNFTPIEYAWTWAKQDMLIPKKLWLKNEKRLLTFREMIDSGLGRCLDGRVYEKEGIELVENTPEEIKDLVVEMEERLTGTWQTSAEDESLQQRFWSLFQNNDLQSRGKVSRIGANFLKQNKQLLDNNVNAIKI